MMRSRADGAEKTKKEDVEEAVFAVDKKKHSKCHEAQGDDDDARRGNFWCHLSVCAGIFIGACIILSLSSTARYTPVVHRVHDNVKSMYNAHKKAKQEYLNSYREAYSESILERRKEEEEEEEGEEEEEEEEEEEKDTSVAERCQNTPNSVSEYDKYGIQLNNSWFHHIHIAKTAGSTMNKRLARRYYGVCGNKYTSCIEPLEHERNDHAPEFGRNSWHPEWSFHSMVSKGFHDCTLVSHERNWDAWLKDVLPDHKFHANATKVMLLPCRNPLEHFFSQCNYNKRNATKIFANVTSCEEGIDKCGLVQQGRFNRKIIQSWDKVVLFKYSAFDSLFSLLDNHIPSRKFLLDSKFDPSTNADRKPENEKLTETCSKEIVVQALKKKWSYYSFCDKLRGNLTVLDVGMNGEVTVVEPVT